MPSPTAREHAEEVLEGRTPFVPPAPPSPPPGTRLIDVTEIETRIEKLVAGGDGLARFQGVPIFIPRAAPGDLVRARIVERKPDYGRAEIVQILEPGPARRPDPVPELTRSSIADLQHLEDDMQTRLKVQAVRETLEHLGHLVLPADVEVIKGEPWGYRLRTQLHTEVDPVAGGVRVGYHARGTNEVIPVSNCPLLVPELEALLRELPAHLVAGGPQRIDLAAGDGGAVTVAPPIEGLPHGEVSTKVGEITYAYDARCFFQSHRGLLPRLVDVTVGPWKGETAVDLYSGVGLFSLPLSRLYTSVIAVESDQIGSRYARLNTRRNQATNLEIVNQVVESWAKRMPEGLDRVIVDPPRGGLAREVRAALLERRPARLTYVSCHPAALARDLRQLQPTYRIESLVFFDLFPQTGHMETVVQMVLAEEGEKLESVVPEDKDVVL
ncbi:MAG: TRAM domain-containing protein [Thermoanaerobaculia bacterium]